MPYPTSFPGRVLGRVALVTGAASGIGEAVAKKLGEQGAKVYLADVSDATQVAGEITMAGGQAVPLKLDVSSESAWGEAFAQIKETDGRLDVLVNNAGISGPVSGLEGTTLTEWEELISINLTGVFLGTKGAVELMKRNNPATEGGASIINMCSIEGLIGDPHIPAYNASKGGVRLFTKATALDVAKRGYNIRINSVHPGYIKTPLISLFDTKELTALHPIGRLGEPEDIANMTLFLASAESKFCTGAEYLVDGGYTAQ